MTGKEKNWFQLEDRYRSAASLVIYRHIIFTIPEPIYDVLTLRSCKRGGERK